MKKQSKIAHLLFCLIEECAEVQKEATKALRFGLKDKYKETSPEQRLKLELNDLAAIWSLLNVELKNSIDVDMKLIKSKTKKLETMIEHSKKRGMLK